LGNLTPEVLDKLVEIMKPVDEGEEFKKEQEKQKHIDWLLTVDHKDPTFI